MVPDRDKLLDLMRSSGASSPGTEAFYRGLQGADGTYNLAAGTLLPVSSHLALSFFVPAQGSTPALSVEMTLTAGYSDYDTAAPVVLPPEAEGAYDLGHCTTRECFIAAANGCRTADVTLAEGFGTVRYSAENCTLTKTVVSLTPGESPEMKRLLEGVSMTCPYAEGKFNPGWVNSLLVGVQECSGRLRDLMGDLVVLA